MTFIRLAIERRRGTLFVQGVRGFGLDPADDVSSQ
jgi:hypothetical protein